MLQAYEEGIDVTDILLANSNGKHVMINIDVQQAWELKAPADSEQECCTSKVGQGQGTYRQEDARANGSRVAFGGS